MQLVEEYTACFLTVPSDRLIAISGLAKAMTFDDDKYYFAGLWTIFFQWQMLWKAAPSRQPKARTSISKTSKYQPPSWSWASVDVEVEFEYKRRAYPKGSSVATIIDNKVSLAGKDLTGAVFGGFVRLKSAIIKVLKESCIYTLLFDSVEAEVPYDSMIYLLLLSSTSGIVMAPVNTTIGQYQRRGYFCVDFPKTRFNEGNVRQAEIESVANLCKDSITALTDIEYESVEANADFGHVFTITIV